MALQTTQKYGLHSIDHLCCGNFGRIEVLLVAAQTLGRQELLKTVIRRASTVVAQAELQGAYKLFANLKFVTSKPQLIICTSVHMYKINVGVGTAIESEHDIEWLAQELSNWLGIPITSS